MADTRFIDELNRLIGERIFWDVMLEGYCDAMTLVVEKGIRLPVWVKAALLDQFEPQFLRIVDANGLERAHEILPEAEGTYPAFVAMEPVLEGREPRRSWDMPPTDPDQYA